MNILKRIEKWLFGSYFEEDKDDLVCITYHECKPKFKPNFKLNFRNVDERDYIIYRY